jgi:hypothetical protein
MLGFCLPFPSDEPDNFFAIPFHWYEGLPTVAGDNVRILRHAHALLSAKACCSNAMLSMLPYLLVFKYSMGHLCAALVDSTARSERSLTTIPTNVS